MGNNPVNFNDPSGNTKNITMDTDWGEYLSRDTSSRRRMYTPYLSNNMAIQIAYIKTLDEIHYKGDTQYYQYFSMNYTPPNLVELNNNTDLANLVSFSRHTNEPFMLRKVAVPYLINFANAANEMGYTLHITDAYRSYSTQLDMFNINRLSENPVIMAGPGSSPHQSGFAVDLYIINKEGNRQGMPKELINIAQEYGLSQTNPADSPHFLIAGPFRGVSDTAFENLRLKGTGFVDTTYGWNQFLSHFVKEESKRYILPNNPKHLYR